MFLRRSESVQLTEEGLDGLCASLNRPVVDLEDAPAGPSQAAIALHRGGDGRRGLFIALRSEGSGAVTLFEFQGELKSARHDAMDTGLSFAEGMGFLFDDDMLLSGGSDWRRSALECWCALTGDELPEPLPEAEILSKFRQRDRGIETAPGGAGQESGQAQLGRIPIVRRRSPDAGAAGPPLLTRLLARF